MQWGGMALAFCGIAIAFYDNGASLENSSGAMLFGDFLGLLAGISADGDQSRHTSFPNASWLSPETEGGMADAGSTQA